MAATLRAVSSGVRVGLGPERRLRLVKGSVTREETVTGQIREKFHRYYIATAALENWARWAKGGAGGPMLSLTSIFRFAKTSEYGEHEDEGLPPEVIAAMKRSEPLNEVGRDPIEAMEVDKRQAWIVDQMLHREQTPRMWRGVAYAFLWAGPEHYMPSHAGIFMCRFQPEHKRRAVSDDEFVTCLESLLEFVDLMLDG